MRKIDPRTEKLAEIVVDHSTSVKEGDRVRISGEPVTLPLMEELAIKVIERGGHPSLAIKSPKVARYLLEHGKTRQICHISGWEYAQFYETDVNIAVRGEEDPLYLNGVNPTNLQDLASSSRRVLDIIVGDGKGYDGKRWCVVGYPTKGVAKQAGMSLEQYERFLYGATNIDWTKSTKRMRRIKELFDNADDVHITVPGSTDFHLSLNGRGGQICDGKKNMPDGEVFYGPVEDSANGIISFAYPCIREGNEISGISLVYENGVLKSFKAKKGMSFLEKKLSGKGMKGIGEFGIGSNVGIDRYTNCLLFDEKIYGTVHVAIGRSYAYPLKNGGGKNEADDHWDLVCELRKVAGQPGGKIYVDNKLVQKDGKWTFSGL